MAEGNKSEMPLFVPGGDLAHSASQTLSYLSVDPSDKFTHGVTGVWELRDRACLAQWEEFEEWIKDIVIHQTGEYGTADENQRVREFYRFLHNFHTALPFDAAEREWFLPHASAAVGRRSEAAGERVGKVIGQFEGDIVSAGLRRRVRGRDLARRWVNWHRESGEYAGQNTLGVARSALAGLIGVLDPQRPLPGEYLALVRERDAAPPS